MRHATPYGFFEITPMPGQPQVAICHGLGVPERLRGQGFGHQLKAVQNSMLARQMFDYALCTVAAGNDKQRRILTRAGWKKLDSFRNTRSCEHTETWGWEVQPHNN